MAARFIAFAIDLHFVSACLPFASAKEHTRSAQQEIGSPERIVLRVKSRSIWGQTDRHGEGRPVVSHRAALFLESLHARIHAADCAMAIGSQ